MSDLSLTSKVLTLSAQDGDELRLKSLLSAQQCGSQRSRCRILELISQSGHPFEAHLSWTAGGGGNLSAKLTVTRGTRVAILARTLSVRVANLANEENRVSGIIENADNFLQTQNTYEVVGYHGDSGQSLFPLSVPPFCQRLSIYRTDIHPISAWFALVYDGQGQVRSATPISKIPPGGLPLGGAGKVELLAIGPPSTWRAIFHLSL